MTAGSLVSVKAIRPGDRIRWVSRVVEVTNVQTDIHRRTQRAGRHITVRVGTEARTLHYYDDESVERVSDA